MKKRLWAPWRMEYVARQKTTRKRNKAGGCLFCRVLKEKRDRENLIVHRSRRSFLILNRYPYNNGHVLVVPQRHLSDFDPLSEEEKLDLIGLLIRAKKGLEKVIRPVGFNVGVNLGRSAGAGVPGHLHLHIVPRWIGDTNFMPVIAETKVISQSLGSLYRLLREVFQEKSSGSS